MPPKSVTYFMQASFFSQLLKLPFNSGFLRLLLVFILSDMALSIVQTLLQQYIQSLVKEGIVNDQFHRILNMKTAEEPDRVVQLIDAYCTDVERILLELESSIDLPEVDFPKWEALAQEIEEKSSYIGAEHVRLACVDLLQACHELSQKNLARALSWLSIEFGSAQNKLEAVSQIERKIIRLEMKQKK